MFLGRQTNNLVPKMLLCVTCTTFCIVHANWNHLRITRISFSRKLQFIFASLIGLFQSLLNKKNTQFSSPSLYGFYCVIVLGNWAIAGVKYRLTPPPPVTISPLPYMAISCKSLHDFRKNYVNYPKKCTGYDHIMKGGSNGKLGCFYMIHQWEHPVLTLFMHSAGRQVSYFFLLFGVCPTFSYF